MPVVPQGIDQRHAKGNKIPGGLPSAFILQSYERERMDRCVTLLQELAAERLGPDWCVEAFGSSANGFGATGSDMDLTVLRKGSRDKCDGLSAVHELQDRLRPILQGCPGFAMVGEAYGAKVPVLKLRFEDSLDVDISWQNLRAVRNTRFLRAYAMLSPDVRDLVIAVKHWAKTADVCGATGRNLSSYSFTQMVIYYMQVEQELKLPCLPTKAFEDGELGWDDPSVQEALAAWVLPRDWSICRLLAGFFRFYDSKFVWGHEVVSVRVGKSDGGHFNTLPYRWAPRVHIEDPFELSRNLHCVLAVDREERLRCALRAAFDRTSTGKAPVGLESLWHSPCNTRDLTAGAGAVDGNVRIPGTPVPVTDIARLCLCEVMQNSATSTHSPSQASLPPEDDSVDSEEPLQADCSAPEQAAPPEPVVEAAAANLAEPGPDGACVGGESLHLPCGSECTLAAAKPRESFLDLGATAAVPKRRSQCQRHEAGAHEGLPSTPRGSSGSTASTWGGSTVFASAEAPSDGEVECQPRESTQECMPCDATLDKGGTAASQQPSSKKWWQNLDKPEVKKVVAEILVIADAAPSWQYAGKFFHGSSPTRPRKRQVPKRKHGLGGRAEWCSKPQTRDALRSGRLA